jgi:FAD/FMN-containing dehydrogenase
VSDDPPPAEALLVWNGMVALLPALAVRPTSPDELAGAVEFARDHGLRLRIEGACPDPSSAERAVTLDLSALRSSP